MTNLGISKLDVTVYHNEEGGTQVTVDISTSIQDSISLRDAYISFSINGCNINKTVGMTKVNKTVPSGLRFLIDIPWHSIDHDLMFEMFDADSPIYIPIERVSIPCFQLLTEYASGKEIGYDVKKPSGSVEGELIVSHKFSTFVQNIEGSCEDAPGGKIGSGVVEGQQKFDDTSSGKTAVPKKKKKYRLFVEKVGLAIVSFGEAAICCTCNTDGEKR